MTEGGREPDYGIGKEEDVCPICISVGVDIGIGTGTGPWNCGIQGEV